MIQDPILINIESQDYPILLCKYYQLYSQSSNLYESLYHLKAYKQNDYFMPEERTLINNRVQSKPVGESQNFKNINPERSQYENK